MKALLPNRRLNPNRSSPKAFRGRNSYMYNDRTNTTIKFPGFALIRDRWLYQENMNPYKISLRKTKMGRSICTTVPQADTSIYYTFFVMDINKVKLCKYVVMYEKNFFDN